MKIAMFGTNTLQFNLVYTEDVIRKISSFGEVSPMIHLKNIEEHKDFLKDCKVAFATWGMPKFTEADIKKYLPNLKILFYAAGTVQYFAKPFLNCGIKVLSAFAANAIPVAEYTFSQISLASKGYFRSAKLYKKAPLVSLAFANKSTGNYKAKVGLVGLGTIGSMVAEKLKNLEVEVFAYDPFASEEKAKDLHVQLVSLEEIFTECDVISNHLANKKCLNNIFNKTLFQRMKPHSVFINTGRGAQINEHQLANHLLLHPSITFLGDVLKEEFFPYASPLFWCPNAILTPHIAGSIGHEPQRMAYYMIRELEYYLKKEPLHYEVTEDMLKTMA